MLTAMGDGPLVLLEVKDPMLYRKWQQPIRLTQLALACMLPWCLTAPVIAQSHAVPEQEYDLVIREARNGKVAAALAKLQVWHAAQPDNQRILHDLIVVLGWSGDYPAALRHFSTALSGHAPVYVFKSLGYAALETASWREAEVAYRRVLDQDPADVDAEIGLVKSWLEQKKFDDAVAFLKGKLPPFPSAYGKNHVPYLILQGRLQEAQEDYISAAASYYEAYRLDPASDDAYRARSMALNRAGMPYLAARLASNRPALFSENERRQLAHDVTARATLYGEAHIVSDPTPERYATTDVALAQNAAILGRFKPHSATHFDRLILLRNRVRMEEVLALYEEIKKEQAILPPYVLAAAADAYLYLEQPEKAKPLYVEAIERAALDDAAGVVSWRVALTYTYLELEEHEQAALLADKNLTTTPAMVNQGNPSVEQPNYDYQQASVAAAMVRMYSDRLKQAEMQISQLRRDAPFNSAVRIADAKLKTARGHPRAALNVYTMLAVDEPELVDAQAGQAETLLLLNEITAARTTAHRLTRDYPENKQVQMLARQVDKYDRPRLFSSNTFGRGAAQAGSEQVSDTKIYSAPLSSSLGDQIRAFTHVVRTDGGEDAASAARTRVGVGLDYRVRYLEVEAQASHSYGTAGKAGVAVSASGVLEDQWRLTLRLDTNLTTLPASAYAAGITGKLVEFAAPFRQDESRQAQLALSHTRISDGNERDVLDFSYAERLHSGPRLKLDATLRLATSRNSASGAVYFNPEKDHEVRVALDTQWLTWRRYEKAFRQRLIVAMGRYYQSGFGTGHVADVRYEHEWDIDYNLVLQYGLGRSIHPYDGQSEKRTYGFANLNWAIKQ